MDKITTKEILVKKVYHNFYCDHCNKFLGTRIEEDDGYYREPEGSDVSMSMPFDISDHFVGLLCDDCIKEFKNKLDSTIISIAHEYGLKPEDDE